MKPGGRDVWSSLAVALTGMRVGAAWDSRDGGLGFGAG